MNTNPKSTDACLPKYLRPMLNGISFNLKSVVMVRESYGPSGLKNPGGLWWGMWVSSDLEKEAEMGPVLDRTTTVARACQID